MRVVTLSDLRPSKRADGNPWTTARVEVADEPEPKTWEPLSSTSLDPVDVDAALPALRSFTTKTDKSWAHVVFVDGEAGEDVSGPIFYLPGPAFLPTVPQVSAILRARTYSTGSGEEDATLHGGELVGVFDETTVPTAATVERLLIPASCLDVTRSTGHVPGEYVEDARRVASLGVSREIERSYVPEEAEETKTLYQTLRMTFESELEALRNNIWLWTLANRGVA